MWAPTVTKALPRQRELTARWWPGVDEKREEEVWHDISQGAHRLTHVPAPITRKASTPDDKVCGLSWRGRKAPVAGL